MKKVLAFFVVAAALAGCGEKETVQSVDWYKENATERKTMIAECNSNPGERDSSPNCVNAQQAEDQSGNARRGWVQPNSIK